jgi:hypothetical protein
LSARKPSPNIYNAGVLVDPNAPVSEDMVDALFLNGLGHPPSPATASGFVGLTNAQAFLGIATSPAMTETHASAVAASLNILEQLGAGIWISGGSGSGSE